MADRLIGICVCVSFSLEVYCTWKKLPTVKILDFFCLYLTLQIIKWCCKSLFTLHYITCITFNTFFGRKYEVVKAIIKYRGHHIQPQQWHFFFQYIYMHMPENTTMYTLITALYCIGKRCYMLLQELITLFLLVSLTTGVIHGVPLTG